MLCPCVIFLDIDYGNLHCFGGEIVIRGCGATSVTFRSYQASGSGSCCLVLIAYFCMNFESFNCEIRIVSVYSVILYVFVSWRMLGCKL